MPDLDINALLARLLAEPVPAAEIPPAALDDLLRKGAILSLLEAGSPEAVAALRQAALNAPALVSMERIVWALGQLVARQPVAAVDALFDLAFQRTDAAAALHLLENHLIDADPMRRAVLALFHESPAGYLKLDPRLQLLSQFALQLNELPLQDLLLHQAGRAGLKNWQLIFQALFHKQKADYSSLIRGFGLFNTPEKTLGLKLLEQAAQAGDVESQSAICQLFIQHEYLPARDLAMRNLYHPPEPLQAALFYFLSEQWQAYKSIDYDASLLISAYETSSTAIQSRLIGLSRSSGQLEWTRRLSSASRKLWLGDLNQADWESILSTLQAGQQWAELWQLAQYAAPKRSAAILCLLQDAGWVPAPAEEGEEFRRLARLAAACLPVSMPVTPLKIWRSPSQEITCLDFDPLSGLLAAGTSQTAIHFWKLGAGLETLSPIFSPIPRTQSLAIGPGGQYFASASGDNVLRLFDLSGGRLIKSMPSHQGLVRALAFHPDGKSLLSASFDYQVLSWRIPQGLPLPLHLNLKAEVFGLAVSTDGNFLLAGGAGKVVQVFRLPEGQLLHTLSPHADTVTALAVAPGRALSASLSRDQAVHIDNYASGRAINAFQSPMPATFACFDADSQRLALGGLDGRVCFQEISTGQGEFLPSLHHAVITGLKLVQGGSGLLSASQDGQLCWWDLRLWRAILTPLEDLSAIDQLLKSFAGKSDQGPAETAWYAFTQSMLDWRRRFDIQLAEEKPVLHIGEFDIEL